MAKRKFKEILPGLYLSNDNLIRTDFEFTLTVPPAGEMKVDQDESKDQQPNIRDEEEYLIRLFRVLSKTTIYGKGYPMDYSREGVLEKAVSLFKGTLLKNHHRNIDEWVGLVKNPKFNTSSNPPGVDCEFWIDKTLNQQHIVRGVKTGAINRCSAGLMFSWVKSHPDLKDRTFWDSLGEIIDDEEVRIIVEEILEVYEVSLVFYGADHTAVALDSGNDKDSISQNQINKNTQEVTTMKNKIISFLKMVKDSSITSRSYTTDADVEQAVDQVVKGYNALADEKVNLTQQLEELKGFKTFHNERVEELKAECLRLLGIVHEGKIPKIQADMIALADYKQLQAYQKDFQEQAEQKVPLTCPKCNLKMERRSSVEVNHEPEQKTKTVHQDGDGDKDNTVHIY